MSISPQQGRQTQPHEQQLQAGRWIPRPSYAQIEGVAVCDPIANFRIKIGLLCARGGNSGSSSTVYGNLIVEVSSSHSGQPSLQLSCRVAGQLEYLSAPFLPAESYCMLEEYLSYMLPANSKVQDLSAEMSTLDWRSLLGIESDAEMLPQWNERNTSWCVLRLCKEAKLV